MPVPTSDFGWSHQRTLDGLAIAALAVLTGIALLTYADYGLGWDDYTHAQMGDLVLALLGSGFTDKRALSFVNLYMYGSGFDVAAALLDRVLPSDLFETRRLLGALLGIVGIALTWRIARRIAGPVAGFAALLLLATCPLYYGHMFINPKDAPFAVAATMLLLTIVRLLDEYPAPKPRSVMLFGVALGLTIGSRVIGGLAAIYAAAGIIPLLVHDAKAQGGPTAAHRLATFALTLSPGLLVGYIVMGLIWPWSVMAPLNPIRALTYFSQFFEKPWKEMFAGSPILVPEMPWSYLPTLLALKLPEIMIASGLCGFALALFRVADGRRTASERAALATIAAALAAPLLITLITRPALYNGVRHFVFLLPPTAILGGVAVASAFEWLSDRRVSLAAAASVFALGIASPAIELFRLHPYEYTHFNRIAGGVRANEEKYMLDYWGLAFKEAAQHLRARLTEEMQTPTDGHRWKIAVCGPHPPAAIELGPEFELMWDPRGADFALMLGEFYCRDLAAPVLVQVERESVVFARVYDIRGRSVTTLLTLPPP
ncbi:MAG: hypothetical protein QOD74_1864 [Variibacter sp.]|nr:hypothetical protein [Variibacter sp.]